MSDLTQSRESYLEEVGAAEDFCSTECEYRWGDNCAAHWIDGGFSHIINDADELNKMALDPTADIVHIKKQRPAHDLLLLEVRGIRHLITDYKGLEISMTTRQWSAAEGKSIKFSRG